MTDHPIIITIFPGRDGDQPMVRVDVAENSSVTDFTNTALVARAMLNSAAYLFAQGQAVQFGPEVPLEVLR